jgi:hypothetical protein
VDALGRKRLERHRQLWKKKTRKRPRFFLQFNRANVDFFWLTLAMDFQNVFKREKGKEKITEAAKVA